MLNGSSVDEAYLDGVVPEDEGEFINGTGVGTVEILEFTTPALLSDNGKLIVALFKFESDMYLLAEFKVLPAAAPPFTPFTPFTPFKLFVDKSERLKLDDRDDSLV